MGLVLFLLQLLLRSVPGLMGAQYKRFFCGYAEPAFIKQRKMQVRTLFVPVHQDSRTLLSSVHEFHAVLPAVCRCWWSW